ncbi:hypothetical protein RB653_008635 [Dictyostelium firmibasis]|uniref:Uncharacterized protein n=1 Tax=Dictyostelium firmibasis TaxID=79012 RepID=A0AAN7YZX6_9MYCE
MKDNSTYRFKEPNFSFPDYYKEFLNLYPEEFDQVSNDIKNFKQQQKKIQVEASCFEQKKDYEDCKEKLSFLHTYFCFSENHKYSECISVNSRKFDRYLKYFIYSNKQSYMKFWEDQEKQYLEKIQQEPSKK